MYICNCCGDITECLPCEMNTHDYGDGCFTEILGIYDCQCGGEYQEYCECEICEKGYCEDELIGGYCYECSKEAKVYV